MADTSDIWRAILKSNWLVLSTRDIAALTGLSLSQVSQMLGRLEKKNILTRVMRGVWALTGDKRFSPMSIIPYLNNGQQNYLSFASALHLHGMLSQIPQIITVATLSHGRRVDTPAGSFLIHRIEPGFFAGFNWHESGNFLVATPEKALVDSFYIASRRGRRYANFPEFDFPKGFSKRKAREWVELIKNPQIKTSIRGKLEALFRQGGRHKTRT